MKLLGTEPEASFHAFAYYMFGCPTCNDTERRLLPRGHALVVERSSVPPVPATVCEQPLDEPANEDAKVPEQAVTVDNKIVHLLNDPAKFIEMFVHNRDSTLP